jgi:hypothetical protein
MSRPPIVVSAIAGRRFPVIVYRQCKPCTFRSHGSARIHGSRRALARRDRREPLDIMGIRADPILAQDTLSHRSLGLLPSRGQRRVTRSRNQLGAAAVSMTVAPMRCREGARSCLSRTRELGRPLPDSVGSVDWDQKVAGTEDACKVGGIWRAPVSHHTVRRVPILA